jgi:catechol 1,2-dioxygenase
VRGRWFSLEHTFVIVPGDDALPPPPVTAKTEGPRARLEVLARTVRED